MILTLLSLLSVCGFAVATFMWRRSRQYEGMVRRGEHLQACVEAGGWVRYEIAPDGAMRWSHNASEVLATGAHGLPDSVEQWLLRIDAQQRDDMRTRYRDLLAGRASAARQFTLRHTDGSTVVCEDVVRPFRAPASRWEVVGLLRNATAFVALQQEAKQARPIVSVGLIASTIAHDLANVLSIIHGQSRLLASAPRPGEAGRLTSAVMAAAERGRQLCQQILFVARPRPLGDSPRSGELMTELRTMLAGMAVPGVAIETALERTDLIVPGNSGRLLQALLNLCINAIEAMKDTGGTLTLRCAPVRIDAPLPSALGIVPVGSYLRFEVCDTGAGIPQRLLSRIFTPGYSTKEGDAPRGLGLAIIASVLAEIGAFIDIDSEEGRGTAVKVYLPSATATAPSDRVLNPPQLGAGESILLVDFDDESLLRLEDMVADLGYEPNAFSSCDEALRSLAAQVDYKAAVVADHMTLGDGTPLHAAIARHMPAFRIILLASSSRTLPETAMPALIEPFTRSDLAALLASVVSR